MSDNVAKLRNLEIEHGINTLQFYQGFEERVKETKRKLLEFLIEKKRAGKQIMGYGAPGKGNTLLNYCGIRQDFLDYTVDRSPQKQGKYTPGCRLPSLDPAVIKETKPDFTGLLKGWIMSFTPRLSSRCRPWNTIQQRQLIPTL